MNGFFERFGGYANFMQQFNQFKQNVTSNGVNPQQQVQQLLNSGRMSQQQFNSLRDIANMITGKKF